MTDDNKTDCQVFIIRLTQLVLAVGLPLLVGFLSGQAKRDEWYQQLVKPTFQPPNIVFPIVWTTLYVLMGVASFLIYLKGGFKAQWLPLLIYVLQLILNGFFTPTFFTWHSLQGAFAICITLTILVAVMCALFFLVSIPAGILIIPYICWGVFATVLGWELIRLNPEQANASQRSLAFLASYK
eukprot:Platyproteum_vivax@DN4116_c0_g1_i1.p1